MLVLKLFTWIWKRWVHTVHPCHVYNLCICEFKIPQIQFAFEVECKQMNGNSATLFHWITTSQIWKKSVKWKNGNLVTVCYWITINEEIFANLMNGNLVTNNCWIATRPITVKLKRKQNLSYSESTFIYIFTLNLQKYLT